VKLFTHRWLAPAWLGAILVEDEGGRPPAVLLDKMVDALVGGIGSRFQVAKEARRVCVGRIKWEKKVKAES
jgi:hypothetical protein